MKTVLIDVDTQYDFCDAHGALFVKGADALTPRLGALIDRGVETSSPIVSSVDSHAFDAWEFAGAPDRGPNGERPGFPPHCVKGTAGWLKIAGTTAPRARFVPNAPLSHAELSRMAHAHAPQQLLLEKEVYSLFANPNADTVLDLVTERAAGVRFVVFGVALDYCVRAAALGLVDWLERRVRRGEVWLVADATAAVDPAGGAAALDECRVRGVALVSTTEALAAFG